MRTKHVGIKLNIGCGEQKEAGWIGLDRADYGQKIIRDLERGLPFCDNSVDEIKADSILEHIEFNDDFVFIMNECYRVLKPDGVMYIRVPHWRGHSRHKDPTHCRDFDEKTFSYLESSNRWKYGFIKNWRVDKTINTENEILEVWLVAEK